MPDFKELILKNGDHISIKDETARNDIQALSTNKLDKIMGKGLSTNDYDNASKTKLDALANIQSIGIGLSLDPTTHELTTTGATADKDITISTESTNMTITDAVNGYLQGVTIKGHSEIVEGEIKSIGDSGRGMVDLGTLDYTYVSNSATPRFMTPLSVIKCKSNTYDITSDLYTPLETFWSTAGNDLKIGSGASYLNISNFAYTDPEAFKAAMSGVFISYPVIDETPLVSITSKDSTGHGTSAIITTGLPLQSTTDGSVYDELDSTTGSVITRCEVVNNEVVAKATPIVTLLTETEKSALASLPTFTNTTVITATDNPVLSIKYFKNNDNGKTVSRIDTDVKSLSKTKIDKPTTDGVEGQALTIDSNGNVVWGDVQVEPIVYDNHKFNKNLPFNDLTKVFANEIKTYGNNPWTWLHARLLAGNLSGIHLGDYIKFSFAIGDGPELEYTARIHTIYKNYYNRYVIDFWCDELLPNKIKWNDKIDTTSANYYFNEGLQNQTGFTMPYYCSTIYAYLNALNGYVCNSATFNSSNNTTLFTFTQEDFTSTGIWNYIPSILKSRIVAKGGYCAIKKAVTAGSYITHSTVINNSSAYLYPTITSVNLGNLWIPTSYDFYIPNKLDITPANPIRAAINNHYTGQGYYGIDTQKVTDNGYTVDAIMFSDYYHDRECLTKYNPYYGLLYDRNNLNTAVEFWLADVSSSYRLQTASSMRANGQYAYIYSNKRCYDEYYVPLCFTIG